MLAGRIKLYPKLPWTRDREISCKGCIFQRIFNERKFKKRIADQQNLETSNQRSTITKLPINDSTWPGAMDLSSEMAANEMETNKMATTIEVATWTGPMENDIIVGFSLPIKKF